MTSAFETNTSDNITKTIHNINEVVEKKNGTWNHGVSNKCTFVILRST